MDAVRGIAEARRPIGGADEVPLNHVPGRCGLEDPDANAEVADDDVSGSGCRPADDAIDGTDDADAVEDVRNDAVTGGVRADAVAFDPVARGTGLEDADAVDAVARDEVARRPRPCRR